MGRPPGAGPTTLLRARHDLSHWTLRFLRKLQLLYAQRRSIQSAAATAHTLPPLLLIRSELRLSMEPATLRLRAEGSRGSFTTPLLEMGCAKVATDLALQQRRLTCSSAPSVWQVWAVDRLHGRASIDIRASCHHCCWCQSNGLRQVDAPSFPNTL